jgi:hypothetical protein
VTQWGVDAIFNPSKRHMDEEKRRLQATRQEIGDNSGGRRIDLLSGKVRISRDPAPANGAQSAVTDGGDEQSGPPATDEADEPDQTA